MEPELIKKEEKKNKKLVKLFVAIATALILVIGGTFAYYQSTIPFENEFKAGKYGVETTENFVSPTDWVPGDTTNKDVIVKNTGSICENVRVTYQEEWKDSNGNTVPLERNGVRAAIINFDNTADWVKDGKYYYYQADLMPGEETNSFISSVTYNPDVNLGYTCETVGNTKTCTNDSNIYAGGTYTLTIKVDTIECDKKDDAWGYAMFDVGTTVNAKIKTMVAGSNKSYGVYDNIVEKMLWSNSLPNNFEATTANTVSASTSPKPIYAWYNDNEKTVYFYTEPDEIYFNPNSSYMFGYFTKVTDLSMIETIDTSRVTNMIRMFISCSNLTSMDVSHFDTSNVKNMESMFSFCSKLTALDLSSFDTSNVKNMSWVFYECYNLTNLDVSQFDTSSVTTMFRMFENCRKLTALDLSSFNTSNVTAMERMFYNCSSLTTLDVSKFDTSNVTDMSEMFNRCSSLTTLDVSQFDTSKVTKMNSMFYNCSSLTTLDVSKFDTSKVTTMGSMFYNCSSLTTLDVSQFDTSKVTSMGLMFGNCSKLTTLDVSHFDTSSVTNMVGMFESCSRLTSLDVSQFDTSNVTTMGSMFSGCSKLTTLDVSHFDTSNVTKMGDMFSQCSKLTTLDVSHFDTSRVTDMSGMFNSCIGLANLDLSNFDTSSVTQMSRNGKSYGMFSGCTNLETIYVSNNFVTTAVTYSTNMFYNCPKLVGGNGTTYDENIIDKTRAVIDTAETPGYFTLKNA